MGNKICVEIGHFEDQGKHYSGYSYPELMAFHNKEDGFENSHVPPRPILDITKFRVDNATGEVFTGLDKVFASGLSKRSLKSYMKLIGKRIKDIEQDVFGTHELPANAEVTIVLKGSDKPMIDQGDLKNKVEVRLINK